MNKVFLIGNLVADPELKEVGDKNVCNMRLAVNRRVGGETEADFYSLKAWRGLADNCMKFLKKGSKVAVCGDISLRNYETKDGEHRTIVEVSAIDIEFLTPKNQEEQPTSTYDKRSEIKVEPIPTQDEFPF